MWVMLRFISRNSDMLEIERQLSMLNSPIIISRYGFHIRSTDLVDKAHIMGFRINV